MSGKKYTMPEFMAALQKMESNVRSNALKKAAMAGGQTVEAYAKVNVMDTFKNVTGNLANGIQTTIESESADRVEVAVGPAAIYGRIQELGGTVKPLSSKKLYWLGEDGKLRSAFEVTLPARPYLAPALNDHENEVINSMSEVLRQEIEGSI